MDVATSKIEIARFILDTEDESLLAKVSQLIQSLEPDWWD